jgi:hypothetical protein
LATTPVPNLQQVKEMVADILQSIPFYQHWDFWIFLAIGAYGSFISTLAYIEAKSAKVAAKQAGRTVKIQTVTIDLGGIAQELDKLDISISYTQARDFLNEISRKIHRMVAPFKNEPTLQEIIKALISSLEGAKTSLSGVRPAPAVGGDSQLPSQHGSTYYAIEASFSEINSLLSELIGLLEDFSVNGETK